MLLSRIESDAPNRAVWNPQDLGDGAKGLALLSGSDDELADWQRMGFHAFRDSSGQAASWAGVMAF